MIFSSDRLGLQWQWNHNPDTTKWTLNERPGYLRLKASMAPDSTIETARNTLTQRLQGPRCEGVTEMDVSGMVDGNVAGLCVFQSPYAYVAIKQEKGLKKIVMVNNGETIETVNNFQGNRIWFKAKADCITDTAALFYSTDSINYTLIGDKLKMYYAKWWWSGYRFALFNYSIKETDGGYVDFDYLHFKSSDVNGNRHSAFDTIQVERYDSESGRDLKWQKGESQFLTNIENKEWIQFDRIDFGKKGTTSFQARIASVSKGTVEIHCDSPEGKLLGTCEINSTGGDEIWKITRCKIKRIKGVKPFVLNSMENPLISTGLHLNHSVIM